MSRHRVRNAGDPQPWGSRRWGKELGRLAAGLGRHRRGAARISRSQEIRCRLHEFRGVGKRSGIPATDFSGG